MYIHRNLEDKLFEWRGLNKRIPIILKGARQVGKTSLIDNFGKSFQQYIKINFEKQPEYIECFTKLEPKSIISRIELLTGDSVDIHNALLFLDEIQECPQAILALRYFKEEMPELAVIGAGSLLEFTLNQENFRTPVGRIKYLNLKPLSFDEFLIAMDKQQLLTHLQQATLGAPPDNIAHKQLLELIIIFFIVGGMPEVVLDYIEKGSIISCQEMQKDLLDTYRNDFSKYASNRNFKYLQSVFSKSPGLVGEVFKYSKVDPELQSRDLKTALGDLVDANLINKIILTNASGLPLITGARENRFKILFLDVGLVQRACGIDPKDFVNTENILLNQGMLAEQFVGQELLTLDVTDNQLFYWARDKKNSQAEVDYVLSVAGRIYPVEVKSGVTGRLKSIQIFLEEKKLNIGIRISQRELSVKDNILSVPFYMISQIPRLLESIK